MSQQRKWREICEFSFFQVMPAYHNPSGKKAYIMNMYTCPEYRRKGIACKTLDMLISDTKSKGITAISLEATAIGRPLYEKYGDKIAICNRVQMVKKAVEPVNGSDERLYRSDKRFIRLSADYEQGERK